MELICTQCDQEYVLSPRMYYKAKRKLCDACWDENQSHRDRFICFRRKDKPRDASEKPRKDRKEEVKKRRSPHHNRSR